MSPTLLPAPDRLRLDCLSAFDDRITLAVTTTAAEARCPLCDQPSTRVHSTYRRLAADLPWSGVAVRLRLTTRRFFCPTEDCERKVFTERLPDLIAPYARRTLRLTEALELIGFALGGEAGARTLAGLSMAASPDTLLRVVRAAALPEPETPSILGVDDFALRRGRTYGTILIDLERRCRVDMLPDRTAETLAAWLEAHPGVEVVTRDRAGAYADGIAQGAPDAVQVADRFHLVKNLGDALQELFNRQRRHLPPGRTNPHPGEGPAAGCRDTTGGASPLASSRAQGQAQQARCQRRRERYERLLALRDQGVSIEEAAAQVGIGKRTAQRWIAAGGFPERKVRRRTASAIDAYQEHIQRRWDEGCRNRTQIWREICEQGYEGAYASVYQYVRRLEAGALTPAAETLAPPGAQRRLSPRQAAWLLLRREESLDAEDRDLLAELKRVCGDARVAHPLVQDFLALVRERKHDEFDRWVSAAHQSGLPELARFATGLRRDEATVRAALCLEHSNGQTEGQVNRLKVIKRQMYGRAKFDLLRRRVLHAA